MFSRYTETARRVIFFARYEASQFGGPYIETEHLLLGLVREDKVLARHLFGTNGSIESLRRQVTLRVPARESVSTSVDMPLSKDCSYVLMTAAAEADELQNRQIDCGHLVLALLRVESCMAAELLREHGIGYASYREIVRRTAALAPGHKPGFQPGERRAVERSSLWEQPEPDEPMAPSLRSDISALRQLVDGTVKHLDTYSDAYGEQHLKRKSWSRKEALGHLINSASAHHQWFTRALVEPLLTANEYPQEHWTSAQQYDGVAWQDLIDLWVGFNRLIVHVLALIPENKVGTPCRIGIEHPISLSKLIHQYVGQCEDLIGQIAARL